MLYATALAVFSAARSATVSPCQLTFKTLDFVLCKDGLKNGQWLFRNLGAHDSVLYTKVGGFS
jgi:hypothetical protein